LLSRAAQTEPVHHDQLWHLDNGDGHVCSHLTLRKVSGGEDEGIETHILRWSGRGIVFKEIQL